MHASFIAMQMSKGNREKSYWACNSITKRENVLISMECDFPKIAEITTGVA